MTFEEYIQNPMGIKNAVYSNRNMYAILYRSKLDKILVREAGKIDIKAYKIGRHKYMCYLKIPSEVIEDFYYDVLIEFNKPKGLGEADLKKYDVKFWSNDPSFVFTFTYAFIKNDMFIKDFKDKMSRKATTTLAKEKNPNAEVGYVKSIYFAYLIMKSRGLFDKRRYVDKYSESALKKEIMHADKKIELRVEAANKRGKTGRKEREMLKRATDTNNNLEKDIPTRPRVSNAISSVKSVGKTGTMKTTKTTKKR